MLLLLAVACSTDDRTVGSPDDASVRGVQHERASQSAADADRDGVPPQIASLRYRERVNPVVSVTVDDERWVASRPRRTGGIGRRYASEYGEVLLLEGKTIARAFPLLGLPPHHLAVTPEAAYCAKRGSEDLPDAMVCRIDRETMQMTARVFPSSADSAWADAEELPPGWTVDDEHLDVRKIVADDAGVWAQSEAGTWTTLDADTLEITARDVERVTTDP